MKKPKVVAGILYNPTAFGDEKWVIERNPEAWKLFLRRTKSFTFVGSGQFNVSLRKEKRRSGEFWYAYKRSSKKLFNAYVGSDDQITMARLSEVTSELRNKIKGFEVQEGLKALDLLRDTFGREKVYEVFGR